MRLSGHSDPSPVWPHTESFDLPFFARTLTTSTMKSWSTWQAKPPHNPRYRRARPVRVVKNRNTQEKEGLGCGTIHPCIGCLDGLAVRLLVPLSARILTMLHPPPPPAVKVGRRRRRKPSRTASQVVEDLSSRSGPLSAEEEARLMRAQVRVRACGCVRAGLWYNLGMRPRARSHSQKV